MTPRFPRMGSREIERLLLQHGFIEKRQTGSHRIFFHPEKRRAVPVPTGKKDLPVGTVKAIIRSAGIEEDVE